MPRNEYTAIYRRNKNREQASVIELKTQIIISRMSLFQKWRVIMKNIVLASLLGFGLISSALANETVNIHERVNNAQAQAHQIQSATGTAGIQGTAPVWPVWISMNKPLLLMKL